MHDFFCTCKVEIYIFFYPTAGIFIISWRILFWIFRPPPRRGGGGGGGVCTLEKLLFVYYLMSLLPVKQNNYQLSHLMRVDVVNISNSVMMQMYFVTF